MTDLSTSFEGPKGWNGWDRWLYPITHDFSLEFEEENAGPVEYDPEPGLFYATKVFHDGYGWPGTGLFYDLEEWLNNNSTLNNQYTISKYPLSHVAPTGASGVEIEVTGGNGDDVELTSASILDKDRAILGWPDTGVKSQSIQSNHSYMGALWLPAFRAQDQRAWPGREAGVSGGGYQAGRVSPNAKRDRIECVYRELAGIDVWPKRTEDQVFQADSDSDMVKRSAFFDSYPGAEIQAATVYMLYQQGRLNDPVFFVYGGQNMDGILGVEVANLFIGVADLKDRFLDAHLEDMEGSEHYKFSFDFLIRQEHESDLAT